MAQDFTAVGLMSGTSADGIDAALVKSDGQSPPELLAYLEQPLDRKLRNRILSLYEPGEDGIDQVGRLDRQLGELFADAALEVIKKGGLTPEQVDVIGSHGQTVRHRPPHFTQQIGNPFFIARRTGVTTVADFRPADLAAGGGGAPLTPLFHGALFGLSGKNVGVLNLGGIANITALPGDPEKTVIAGDTGPANTLMDLFAEINSQGRIHYDPDGSQAARGRVDADAFGWLISHPFFKESFPKSTGREVFGRSYLDKFIRQFPNLTAEDRFATLTRLTVDSVVAACREVLPPFPDRLVLCGGGIKNPVLRKGLNLKLPKTEIVTSSDLGVDAHALESQAFAWFAVRTLKNLPSSLPNATGADAPSVLGSIHPGKNWAKLCALRE